MIARTYNKSLKNGSNTFKEYVWFVLKESLKHTRFVCLVDVIIKRSIIKFRCPLEYQKVKTHVTIAIRNPPIYSTIFPIRWLENYYVLDNTTRGGSQFQCPYRIEDSSSALIVKRCSKAFLSTLRAKLPTSIRSWRYFPFRIDIYIKNWYRTPKIVPPRFSLLQCTWQNLTPAEGYTRSGIPGYPFWRVTPPIM